MATTYQDIAARPVIASYPVVLMKENNEIDAAAAAEFQRILNAPAASGPANSAAPAAAGEENLSFVGFIKGLFDVINPLQHIPVVGTLYRHITGDEIAPVARFAGDALYGGPIGGAIAAVDIAWEKSTGKDMGETVMAALTGPAVPDDGTQVAQNLNNQISPAAGEHAAVDMNDIIWNTSFPLPPPPAVSRAGASEIGPADASTPASPVLQAKGNASVFRLTTPEAGSTIALQAQEAPADTAGQAVPPELIAAKMMEALDKYAAMKRDGLAPAVSGVY